MYYAKNIKTSKVLYCTRDKTDCIEEAFGMCTASKHTLWLGIIPLAKERFTLENKIEWLELQNIIIFELAK